ncbi:MAG: hypothetical protein K8I29_14170 [Alphaproteobacteria bacterium]|uniref:Rhodanese domain-containing protein n=1 Tax=Candidatus Nitrobium versatile TaxID=2884831 RepID=A0A953JC87_9BACT|nr:hypothetical protein [Candidatus Nitrobium versatile]
MEIPRMEVSDLKAKMDAGEPIILLDVRQPAAYASSPRKIRGAVYVDPNDEKAILNYVKNLDRNTEIVTY